MKIRVFSLVLTLLFSFHSGFAQQRKPAPRYQIWEFMTRSTMTLKVVAKRFHVEEKLIKKLSKYRKKKVYPGTVLRIPVLVREPVWNPENFNPNQAILPEEDSRTKFEYEWNNEKLDPRLQEDFVILREIQADSAQMEKLSRHIGSLNKYILVAKNQLDSIKQSEFAFEYDSADLNSVLKRMKLARDNYYASSPIGRQLDSLSYIKNQLGEESVRIQTRLNEFEYLAENADYFQRTKGGERSEVSQWEKRFIAESRIRRTGGERITASNLPKTTVPDSTSAIRTRVHGGAYVESTIEGQPTLNVRSSYVGDTTNKESTASDVRIRSSYVGNQTKDTLSEAEKKALALKEQIEKVKDALKRPITDEDILEKYEMQNHKMIEGISISPLPIAMEKGKPRYEIIPDATTLRKAEGYLYRFKEALKENDINEAVRQLEKAINVNPHNATAWSYHAELQAVTNHTQEAIREFTIAENISAKNARPSYKLGLLYEFSNNAKLANEYYTKAMQADANYFRAFLAHAKLAQKQGNIVAAIVDYNHLLNIRPSYVNGFKERGMLKTRSRDYEGSANDYTVYLETASPDGETLYRRGMARTYSGNIIGGCEDFNAAQRLNYKDAELAITRFCK